MKSAVFVKQDLFKPVWHDSFIRVTWFTHHHNSETVHSYMLGASFPNQCVRGARTHMHARTFAYIYIYTHIHIPIYLYIDTLKYMHTCIRTCMYVWTHICICMHVLILMYVRIHEYTYVYTNVHTDLCINICAKCIQSYIHIRTNLYVCIYTPSSTYNYTSIHMCACVCM